VEERRYRLRQGPEIVGFLRDIQGSLFYSRDGFWWTGIPIRYEHVDEWTGWMDVQRKRIYEWDLVEYTTADNKKDLFAVLRKDSDHLFGLRNIKTDDFFPFSIRGVELFEASRCKVISHVFINPELMEAWDLRDE
jgi:hypothetical protein